jgi:hypothetical protein
MERPYYRDKDGVEFRSSQRFVEAADFALRSLAKFLGREDEYEAFVKSRKMVFNALDNPNASQIQYEEYLKSIPNWVKIMEEPLSKMYYAGLEDGRDIQMQKQIRKSSFITLILFWRQPHGRPCLLLAQGVG